MSCRSSCKKLQKNLQGYEKLFTEKMNIGFYNVYIAYFFFICCLKFVHIQDRPDRSPDTTKITFPNCIVFSLPLFQILLHIWFHIWLWLVISLHPFISITLLFVQYIKRVSLCRKAHVALLIEATQLKGSSLWPETTNLMLWTSRGHSRYLLSVIRTGSPSTKLRIWSRCFTHLIPRRWCCHGHGCTASDATTLQNLTSV